MHHKRTSEILTTISVSRCEGQWYVRLGKGEHKSKFNNNPKCTKSDLGDHFSQLISTYDITITFMVRIMEYVKKIRTTFNCLRKTILEHNNAKID